jgi:hypothetical protein
MGKYLDLARRARTRDKSDKSDESPQSVVAEQVVHNLSDSFGRLNRFCRTLQALERSCPDHVDVADWQKAVDDARHFLAHWGEQAEALNWTVRDLFGLHKPPDTPAPSYRRLSRYDETGLFWLLRGRPVVALTEATAAIQNPTGNVTTYRRQNKPALGPVGDSLNELK